MPQESSRIIRMIADSRITLPQGHNPTGRGRALFAVGAGTGVGFSGVAALSGANASQDLVSTLTCMPYFRPACTALVQSKNFSPCFGLKLKQLPHILLLICFHLLSIIDRQHRFLASRFKLQIVTR